MILLSRADNATARTYVNGLLQKRIFESSGTLAPLVRTLLKKRIAVLRVAKKHSTPFYLFDADALEKSIASFSRALKKYVPRAHVFYAVKTNHYQQLLKMVHSAGFGFDVSSVRELLMCQKIGTSRMIFSGPGKTNEALRIAYKHHRVLTVLLDSFGELERIGSLQPKKGARVRVGVRIHSGKTDGWEKFGIPLSELAMFWRQAKHYKHIALCGIQFHHSHNASAASYAKTLKTLGAYIKKHFTTEERKEISFIDCGGGFLPYQSEGIYSDATPQGIIINEAYAAKGERALFRIPYLLLNSVPVDTYIRDISSALKKYIEPVCSCEYYFEPGRIICNNAMHVVLRVVDVKSPECVILDGGSNIIGWERLSYDYFPVLNLTRPSLTEHRANLYGNLCMPTEFDSWGRFYFGSRLEKGDLLMIPYQGCLTYSLAQNFIHPIPPVYPLS